MKNTFFLICLMMLMLTSCVKDDLHDMGSNEGRSVFVTADFSKRSAESVLPDLYYIKMGNYEQEATGETNELKENLAPGSYSLLVNNRPEGMSVSYTWASVNILGNGYREHFPGYLFGSFQQASVATTGATQLVAEMRQYTHLLNVCLNVTEGDYQRVSSVSCTLGGVESAADLGTGKLAGIPCTIGTVMTQNADKLLASFRILGIVPQAKQNLGVVIRFTDGSEQSVVCDLTDTFSNFDNEQTDPFEISGNIHLPLEAGVSASIVNWKSGNSAEGEDIGIK